MSHTHHESLPGYRPGQLLVDGCPECMARGADPLEAMAHLDNERFAEAWQRAADWQRSAGPVDGTEVSQAEIPLLRTLWYVQVALERRGWPLGVVPSLEYARFAGLR